MRHFHRFLSTSRSSHTNFGACGRQKSDISHGFCLLPGPRTIISESQVDKNQTFPTVFVYFQVRAPQFRSVRQTKIRHFPRFLSTSRSAHHNFGESGRQNSDISPRFCLLPGPRTTISESQVDKIHTFLPVFVYFQSHAPKFARNYQRCYKDYVKSKTLPNSVANGTAFPTKRDFIHLFPKTPKNAGPICRCVIIIIFI